LRIKTNDCVSSFVISAGIKQSEERIEKNGSRLFKGYTIVFDGVSLGFRRIPSK